MRRMRRFFQQQWVWLLMATTVFLLSMGLVFAPFRNRAHANAVANSVTSAVAKAVTSAVANGVAKAAANAPTDLKLKVAADSQFFSEDVTISEGETFASDVVVYNGNVTIESGGQIEGNLIVYSGDIEIAEGGVVQGNVTSVSGNLQVAGEVGGDIAVWSGDVGLAETAVVGGNVSLLHGEINRDEGATIGGNVINGPRFTLPLQFGLPKLPALPEPPAAPEAPAPPDVLKHTIVHEVHGGPTLFGRVGMLFGRLFAAAFVTSMAVLGTGLLYHLRPNFVQPVRTYLMERTALSFAFGLIANLVMAVLIPLLVITLCLAPLGLLAALLAFGVNLVGWTATAQLVGERLLRYADRPTQPLIHIGVGALMLTGVISFVWAWGGCFQPLAGIMALGAASFGSGATILAWLKRRATLSADRAASASAVG